MSRWQHLKAILILPVMATVTIPVALLGWFGLGTLEIWEIHLALKPTLIGLGFVIAMTGLFLVVTTIRQFASVGDGTLAPWNPTQKLVIEGVYRHVRNPMISGVMAILIGESLASGSIPLLVWFAIFATINAIYIPFSEEPGLVKRFGDDYQVYRMNVPRWLPRIKSWQGEQP